jgi:hypothetical protein
VRKCSAVFGEDMWQATDIRRMRWAINNRTSKVSNGALRMVPSKVSNGALRMVLT